MTEQRYCPECYTKVSAYLGQSDIYMCHTCDRSYEKSGTRTIQDLEEEWGLRVNNVLRKGTDMMKRVMRGGR